MLSYNQLKEKPRELLAATSLTAEEFEKLLPAFEAAYQKRYLPQQTLKGKDRQRQPGADPKGKLASLADKLLFILVFEKTNPLQSMHGLQFGLSQAQTNYWIHHLLPVLQQALRQMGHAPERDAARVATNPLVREGGADLLIDGTERRRQRPQDASEQRQHYSGKKKAHTDKNILLVNEHSTKVVYLSQTLAGKTHDKKAADEAQIAYPSGATVSKDTGFQGYEPAGVLTQQPKKSHVGRS